MTSAAHFAMSSIEKILVYVNGSLGPDSIFVRRLYAAEAITPAGQYVPVLLIIMGLSLTLCKLRMVGLCLNQDS